MPRVLAIDYGLKRCGIAVTDEAQILAQPLTTVPTSDIWAFLDQYLTTETVSVIVLGFPTRTNGEDSHITEQVRTFSERLKAKFREQEICLIDERFTSKIAQQTLVLGGMKKKNRQDKANIDMVSAALILQTYLEQQN